MENADTMNDTIDFTPEAVKQYLVAAVKVWRERRQEAKAKCNSNDQIMAAYYIDAFQSVHMSLFGTLAPEEEITYV